MKKVKSIWARSCDEMEGNICFYDKNGHVYFCGSKFVSENISAIYDDRGNCVECSNIFDSGDGYTVIENETFSYNDAGQLLKREYKGYSRKGRTEDAILTKHDIEQNEYDDKGRMIFHKVDPILKDETSITDNEYFNKEYDNEENCIYETNLHEGVKSFEYENGKCKKIVIRNYGCPDIINNVYSFQYDEEGNLMHEHHKADGYDHRFSYNKGLLSSEEISCYKFIPVKTGNSAQMIAPEYTEGLYRICPDEFNELDFPVEKYLFYIKESVSHGKDSSKKKIQMYLVEIVDENGARALSQKDFFQHNYSKIIEIEQLNLNKDFLAAEFNVEEIHDVNKKITTTKGHLDEERIDNKLIEGFDEQNDLIHIEYFRNEELVFEQCFEYVNDIRCCTCIKATYPKVRELKNDIEVTYWDDDK